MSYGMATTILRVNLTEGHRAGPSRSTWSGPSGVSGRARARRPSTWLTENMDPAADAAGSGQRADLRHRAADRHHVASTSGRYAVVTKGPLTGAIACSNSGGKFGGGAQVRRLRHADRAGPGRQGAGLPAHRRRQGRTSCRRTRSGAPRCGTPKKRSSERHARSPVEGRLDRRRRRTAACASPAWSTTCTAPPGVPASGGDGLEEPESGRRARHQGRAPSTIPVRFMAGQARTKAKRCWPTTPAPPAS